MPTRVQTQFVARIALVAALFAGTGCGEDAPPDAPPAPQAVAPTQSEGPPTSVTPEAIEQSLAAADSYLNSGELGKARSILAVLVEKAPREVRARELFGQVLLLMARQAGQEGDEAAAADLQEQAYRQYQFAIKYNPGSAGLHHSAGMVAHSAGLIEEALAHYQEAGRLDPLDPQPPTFAAQVLIVQRRLEEAEEELQRALTLDPDLPVVHASLGLIDMQQDRFEDALAHIVEARALDPRDIGLLAQEARIHRRAGRPERALELLSGLPAHQRARRPVTIEIAAGYEAIGQPEKAAGAWVNRLRSSSLGFERWRDAVRASEAFLKAGQRGQAWSWLQEAKLQAPDAPEVKALEEALGTDAPGY